MNRYGRITIIGQKIKNSPKVLCKCDCGKEKMINIYNLKLGDVKSCGCLRKESMTQEAKKRFTGKIPSNAKDYTGMKIGCIFVLDRCKKNSLETEYLVRCDCSEEFLVLSSNLKRSKYKKCICNYKTHPLKVVLQKMIERCEKSNCKSYKWYGAKGIKVCEEWKMFPTKFITWSLNNGYIHGLTIDRIDSSKDYCPENCQWISRRENAKKSAVERWNLTQKV
jgi:hypothetical protein